MTLQTFLHEYLAYPAIGLTIKDTLMALLMQRFIGLPIGLYVSGKKNMTKNIVEIIVTLPMIFPPMALGFFLLLILGKNGLIGNLIFRSFHFKIIFSYWGVLAATFILGLPFMVKSVQDAKQQMDTSLTEAAATLGKTRFSTMVNGILPNIKNGIIAGMLLSFGRSI